MPTRALSRDSRPAVFVLAMLVAVALGDAGLAEQVTLSLNPGPSRVDMTAFGYVDNEFFFTGPTSTRDTQTIPLGGTITLDVSAVGGVVESVDFVSLRFDYLTDPENPTVHKRVTLRNSSEGVPKGAEIEVHLPFIEELAAGNPVPRYAPTLTLDSGDAGAETGAGGELLLTAPDFRFVGSGQYFNLPTDPDETPFVDGWPMDYGPYPSPAPTPFPAQMPGVDYLPGDAPNTTMSPAPEGPDSLQGVVSLVGDAYVFRGSLFSKGVGGAGVLQTAQVHEATFFASTVPILPGDYNDDGFVGAEDYTVWRDNLGAPAGALPNDVDGGVVDGRQYLTWKENYGAATPAPAGAATAPEPSTLVAAAAAALLTFSRGRRLRPRAPASLVPASLKGQRS